MAISKNYTQLKTVLKNSDLSDKGKDFITNAFLKMSPVDQMTFVSLLREKKNRLRVAANFLKDMESDEEITDSQIKTYLYAMSKEK